MIFITQCWYELLDIYPLLLLLEKAECAILLWTIIRPFTALRRFSWILTADYQLPAKMFWVCLLTVFSQVSIKHSKQPEGQENWCKTKKLQAHCNLGTQNSSYHFKKLSSTSLKQTLIPQRLSILKCFLQNWFKFELEGYGKRAPQRTDKITQEGWKIKTTRD